MRAVIDRRPATFDVATMTTGSTFTVPSATIGGLAFVPFASVSVIVEWIS